MKGVNLKILLPLIALVIVICGSFALLFAMSLGLSMFDNILYSEETPISAEEDNDEIVELRTMFPWTMLDSEATHEPLEYVSDRIQSTGEAISSILFTGDDSVTESRQLHLSGPNVCAADNGMCFVTDCKVSITNSDETITNFVTVDYAFVDDLIFSFEINTGSTQSFSAEKINSAYKSILYEVGALKYDTEFWRSILNECVYYNDGDRCFYTVYGTYPNTSYCSWPRSACPLRCFICAIDRLFADSSELTAHMIGAVIRSGDCNDISYSNGAIYVTWNSTAMSCSLVLKYDIGENCVTGMSIIADSIYISY